MDVREIVISEFKSVFDRHGFTTPQEFLRVAETPFDLRSVQQAVDRDIERIRDELRFETTMERNRRIQIRESHHKEELKRLSRQYALRILKNVNRGESINESMAKDEKRLMKAEAVAVCDMYPC